MDLAQIGGSFANALAAVFVIVGPLGAVPTFAALTSGRPDDEVRRVARRTSLTGAGVLVAFTLAGGPLLRSLSVELDAFRAAGGLLLLLTALEMLRGKASQCGCGPIGDRGDAGDDIAIVPLAVPLLAGPGAMATVMMLASSGESAAIGVVLASIAVTFGTTWALFRVAGTVNRMAGPSATAVIQRVFGLLMAAIAIQFIVAGLSGVLGLEL